MAITALTIILNADNAIATSVHLLLIIPILVCLRRGNHRGGEWH